jgi:hypothetical protein
MPRVDADVDQCIDFVRRQPWGKPEDRRRDIRRGIKNALLRRAWNYAGAKQRNSRLFMPTLGQLIGSLEVSSVSEPSDTHEREMCSRE